MNAIMDIQGKTIYRVDDSQPASDSIIWSSLKASKFFWRNTLKANKFVTITKDNTDTTLTIPFNGTAMICIQGYFTAGGVFFNNTNGSDVGLNSMIRKNNTPGNTCGHYTREVIKGERFTFNSQDSGTYEVQVYEIS
jgi:hypothetical protein